MPGIDPRSIWLLCKDDSPCLAVWAMGEAETLAKTADRMEGGSTYTAIKTKWRNVPVIVDRAMRDPDTAVTVERETVVCFAGCELDITERGERAGRNMERREPAVNVVDNAAFQVARKKLFPPEVP